MKKYVIERDVAGVGSLSRDELHGVSARSNQALEAVGPDIQWVHSYVTDDKTYCIYLAENKKLVEAHASRSGFPANKVSEVRAIIDPTMGAAAAVVGSAS